MLSPDRVGPGGLTQSKTATIPSPERLRELYPSTEALLRSAILTLAAAPDPERRYLAGLRSSSQEPNIPYSELQAEYGLDAVLEVAQEAREVQARRAYRYRPERKEFDRMLEVLGWLSWLGRQNNGRRDVRIIMSWAHGVPTYKTCQYFGRHPATIDRWRKQAIQAITAAHWERVEWLALTL